MMDTGVWENARLISASCLAASRVSAAGRPGQTGSLTNRTRCPGCESANARSAGMRRPGLRPSSAMSP